MQMLKSHFVIQRLTPLIAIATLMMASFVHAEELVSIDNAWVRSTSAGQNVGAAYMTLTSKQNVTLIKATSDVTKTVEMHSMSMHNGIMKMRMLDELPVEAGKPLKLEPGGLHLMLFDLKKPLAAGQYVNFELTFKSGSQSFKQSFKAPVQSGESEHSGHHHHH